MRKSIFPSYPPLESDIKLMPIITNILSKFLLDMKREQVEIFCLPMFFSGFCFILDLFLCFSEGMGKNKPSKNIIRENQIEMDKINV